MHKETCFRRTRRHRYCGHSFLHNGEDDPHEGGHARLLHNPGWKIYCREFIGWKVPLVLDPNTSEILWTVNFDKGVTTSAFEVAKDGSTSRIFSGLSDYHGFAVIDFATQKEVKRIELPEPKHFRLGGQLSAGTGSLPMDRYLS